MGKMNKHTKPKKPQANKKTCLEFSTQSLILKKATSPLPLSDPMLIWTHSICHPQESQDGHIWICILQSFLLLLWILITWELVCAYTKQWRSGALGTSWTYMSFEFVEKIELSHTPQVENPVCVTCFLHRNKGNKMKPYRGLNGHVCLAFSLYPMYRKEPAKLLSEAPLPLFSDFCCHVFEPLISISLSSIEFCHFI